MDRYRPRHVGRRWRDLPAAGPICRHRKVTPWCLCLRPHRRRGASVFAPHHRGDRSSHASPAAVSRLAAPQTHPTVSVQRTDETDLRADIGWRRSTGARCIRRGNLQQRDRPLLIGLQYDRRACRLLHRERSDLDQPDHCRSQHPGGVRALDLTEILDVRCLPVGDDVAIERVGNESPFWQYFACCAEAGTAAATSPVAIRAATVERFRKAGIRVILGRGSGLEPMTASSPIFFVTANVCSDRAIDEDGRLSPILLGLVSHAGSNGCEIERCLLHDAGLLGVSRRQS